jgi:hypothetical protein
MLTRPRRERIERRIRGRGSAIAIRTPQLVLAYLSGEEFLDKTGAPFSINPEEGDHVARIHQSVKRRIRVQQPRYQFPRRNSFQTLIANLITLGLVEETSQTAEPQERGAGRLGTTGGFKERQWVRLTPGAADRP